MNRKPCRGRAATWTARAVGNTHMGTYLGGEPGPDAGLQLLVVQVVAIKRVPEPANQAQGKRGTSDIKSDCKHQPAPISRALTVKVLSMLQGARELS